MSAFAVQVNKVYLVLEYVKLGDLINILKKRSDPSSANGDCKEKDKEEFVPLVDLEVWNIARQLVAGIRYLHFQNVLHGDIKPQVWVVWVWVWIWVLVKGYEYGYENFSLISPISPTSPTYARTCC